MGLKTFCKNGCNRSGKFDGVCNVCAGVTHRANGRPYNNFLECAEEGCNFSVYAKAKCSKHYNLEKYKAATTPGDRKRKPTVDIKTTPCPFPDCEQFSHRAPFCRDHVKHWYKFPMNPERYLELRGVTECQACGDDTKKLVFDHDHSCCPGKQTCGRCVRGVICHDCNVALGYLRNDPSRAEKLAVYAYSIRK